MLSEYGSYKVFEAKAKGAHRMLVKVDSNGKKEKSIPIPYHGKKAISRNVLGTIKRGFKLPDDFFDSKKPYHKR